MKLNSWEIMTHYARIAFSPQGVDADVFARFRAELHSIPGVKCKQGLWWVPANALAVVLDVHGATSRWRRSLIGQASSKSSFLRGCVPSSWVHGRRLTRKTLSNRGGQDVERHGVGSQ
jgi:hypothetical protein